MSIRKNKKAITTEFVILTIISLITLVLIVFYVNNSIKDSNYSTSISACNMFISNIDGKPAFFGSDLKSPSNKLIDSISSLCPSKTVKVTNKDVSNGADLINDCYKKTGSGEDFYAANSYDVSICIYCGKIETENEINNFNTLLKEELKKEEYKNLFDSNLTTVNLNKDTLSNVPSSISEQTGAYVFYYSYKPQFPKRDIEGNLIEDIESFADSQIQSKLSQFVGTQGDYATLLNYYISSSGIVTYSGIIVDKEISNQAKNLDEVKTIMQNRGCYLIVPNENFE